MPAFILIVLLMASGAFAQSRLEFEAASVRPAAPAAPNEVFSMQGGPGSSDPGRISFRGEPLENLLLFAFSLQPDRLEGPGWLQSQRFDITASLAPESSRDQLMQMMQNLLVSRFGLTYHYAAKEFTVYSLVIAKGGLKLKPSAVEPAIEVPRDQRPPKFAADPDGFPTLAADGLPQSLSLTRNGVTSMSVRGQTLVGLVRVVQNSLGAGVRVVDHTGLAGFYDYRLRFASKLSAGEVQPGAPGSPEPVPDIFSALPEQLGLTLERGSERLDVLMVDRIERAPTPD